MNTPSQCFSLEEYKIQASILLKSLSSKEIFQQKLAADRLQHLPEFAGLSFSAMQVKRKRKHVLAVIAFEKGFKSWAELKQHFQKLEAISFADFIVGGFLNLWFTNYEEAKLHQQSMGGFLLPLKKQFFICETVYIKQLGFAADDVDWQLIGRDWVKPQDEKAWHRLGKKWLKILESRHEK